MSFRLWIGAWIFVILLILVAVDASALVCYITRFTEENFATLIAFIFIYKAVENVIKIGVKYPIETGGAAANVCICEPPKLDSSMLGDLNWTLLNNEDCLVGSRSSRIPGMVRIRVLRDVVFALQKNNGTLMGMGCPGHGPVPDVFLMSILLFVGTFLISVELKDFKNALFFPSKVRREALDWTSDNGLSSVSGLMYSFLFPGETVYKRLRRHHSHLVYVTRRLVRRNQNTQTASAERFQAHIGG